MLLLFIFAGLLCIVEGVVELSYWKESRYVISWDFGGPHPQIHFRVGMRQMKLSSQGPGLHLDFLNMTPWKSHAVVVIEQFGELGLFPHLCFFSFNGVQLAPSSLLAFTSHIR